MTELRQFLEDNGYECRSYSGRGMYGKNCLGVVVDAKIEMFHLAYEAGQQQVQFYLEKMEWDSMGLSTIFYWPGVPFVEEEDDDFEDEDDEDEGE
jgi:hypothetical protein